MTDLTHDDLSRLRLSWPEPLLIDLICERYEGVPETADCLTPARIHARFLFELFEEQIRAAASSRVELISCCAARGISAASIHAADQAAFLELMTIIRTRFRNSPRLCLHLMQKLHLALNRLPKQQPAPAASLRPAMVRRHVTVPRAFAPTA